MSDKTAATAGHAQSVLSSQKDIPAGGSSGDNNGTAGLTMEEKLALWRQAKLQRQKAGNSKNPICGGSRRSLGGTAASNGGVKRSLVETKAMGCSSKATDSTTSAEPSDKSLSTLKKSRVASDFRRNVAESTKSNPAVNVKRRLPVSTEKTPKSASAARVSRDFRKNVAKATTQSLVVTAGPHLPVPTLKRSKLASTVQNQEGRSLQHPIVIDGDSAMAFSSPASAATVRPPHPVSAKRVSAPKPASVTQSEQGSPQCPIVIDDDGEISLSQLVDPLQRQPCRITKKLMLEPEMTDREISTSLNEAQPRQNPALVASTDRRNNREIPISVNQPTSKQCLILTDKESVASNPRAIWSEDPAFDKENQSDESIQINQMLAAPAATVEKKPELLAKDLIRVAIEFEKKRRLATAYSIFKRANYVLPKESTRLIERLDRLQQECPTAEDQAPSQQLSTAAYMVKVLERDLMSVLNHGTTSDLTQLHAIGAKRAELVLDRRPYQQLEELRRVPGMSANVIARLYQHHTKWENHQ